MKVLCTDLDGTLFYPKKKLRMMTSQNKRFLRRFVNDGNKLVLVTSRHISFLEKVRKKLGVPCDFIAADGAAIECDGKLIQETYFDTEKLKALVKDLRTNGHADMFLLSSKDHGMVMTRSAVRWHVVFLYIVYMLTQGVYREKWIRSDQVFYNEIEKGLSAKLMLLVGVTKKKIAYSEKLTKELEEKYPDFNFMWLKEFIEITPKGCSKADGVSYYLEHNNISADNVLVVGDSGNDVPMFDRFPGRSFCMSHAPASVRERAAHTVDRVSDLEKMLYPSVDSNSPETKEGKK